ncbi:MAG: hypothetical protein A2762_05385 [Candidatus Lloydbacteria bacterium RIFCSPHIGHO2_01_FULL_54_11]|nr:MAG: hypothetical protein A2762_05385 [Candidatus Lloydbacteria bacterium RIFCSPHIGHO2_01_FULL_54_11]
MGDRKIVPTPLPEHEATALVQSVMREQFMREAGALFEACPDHPKVRVLNDPKRWEGRFNELIAALPPDARLHTNAMLNAFVSYWDELSEPARVVAAQEVAKAIVGMRVYATITKESPEIFFPAHGTLQ